MRYLNQTEILAYINAGKEIEQYLGEFYYENYKCHRYITFGKDKNGYYGLLFEKFDDSENGLESIYDFSSIEPDDLYGKEIGSFQTFEELLANIDDSITIKQDKYLISGQINELL